MASISLNDAKTMAQRYSNNRATVLKTQYDVSILPLCETFTKSEIHDLISQTGCVSSRIYLGMTDDLKVHAIMVAVDSQGADILPPSSAMLVEDGQRCPPNCPSSPLYS
jgi:hypothetical protein